MLILASEQQAQTVNMGFIGLILLSPLAIPSTCLPEAATLTSAAHGICSAGLILQHERNVKQNLSFSNAVAWAATMQCVFTGRAEPQATQICRQV